MTDALIPPVPPECDLRDFGFIPLEFRRLFTSETWLLAKDAEKLAALTLWCESWHQVPASSLPDNDRVLAMLSQTGGKWPRIKSHALRGWIKCTDGRLYHPVVAEKALDAWEKKLEQRRRTHAARVAALRKRMEHATGDELHLLETQLQALLSEVTGSKGQGQLKGEGREGTGTPPQNLSAAARRRGNGEVKTGPAWEAFTIAYRARYNADPTRNAVENAAMAAFVELVPLEEAPAIAQFYVGHSKAWYVSHQHSVKYLRQDAAGLRTQWLAGRKVTDAEARQVDRTAGTGDQVNRLLAEAASAGRRDR